MSSAKTMDLHTHETCKGYVVTHLKLQLRKPAGMLGKQAKEQKILQDSKHLYHREQEYGNIKSYEIAKNRANFHHLSLVTTETTNPSHGVLLPTHGWP